MDSAGERKRFEDPVLVELNGRGYLIVELADAGDLLVHSWPTNSPRRHGAMLAVMLALRGQGDVARARKAFVAAALEIFALRSAA